MNASEFKNHLTNQLIPFWNNLKDNKYGGYYGYVDHDLKIHPEKEKGVILNNRILWFYSNAYTLLKDSTLLDYAEHAYKFLTGQCIDSQYGGVYWSLNYDGTPLDDSKHTYNQAFAIYALSSYYEASGDKKSIEAAYDIFNIIETKCRDKDGYLEAFDREFNPASNEKLSENGVMAERTMNTLLHVMEAYTELYRVDKKDEVKKHLLEILSIFKSKIYDADKKMDKVFFDIDYNSIIDLHSYGHDIETSWLLYRTAEILDDPDITREIKAISLNLAKTISDIAVDTSVYALNNECENSKVDTQKIWWVQAESVIGFYNAYQLQPEQENYKLLSEKIWKYINTHIIDSRSGEWFESIRPDGTVNETQAMVQPWKCPYHNGRMCMEMIKRLS
ncbi:MAG: AGE family epimerase/isomerase [Lachnospiraceae bacterium]|nr:AGE family epimerase/isomerase [Lachnospiraceae bacterium]